MTLPRTFRKSRYPSWPSPLRDRVLACLGQSLLAISTVDLALICEAAVNRVWQVLVALEVRGRVRRIDGRPLRWALTAEGGVQ